MTKTRADRMRHNARLLDDPAAESQKLAVAAEDQLTRLEDRDERRRRRSRKAMDRLGLTR